MKKIIMLLILAAGAAAWYVMGTSDTARVRKTFAKAVSAFRKDGTESAYTALAKSRTLAELIGPVCRLEIPERNYVSLFVLFVVVTPSAPRGRETCGRNGSDLLRPLLSA